MLDRRAQVCRDCPGEPKTIAKVSSRAKALKASSDAPHGVGYGAFYHQSFKRAFDSGTDILWTAICPEFAGGNVNTWLYLTAMNRAALSVEAHIAYRGKKPAELWLFDWSTPEMHHQRLCKFAALAPYLGTASFGGADHPTLTIWNTTEEISSGRWKNSVSLFDRRENDWALIYSHEYAAQLSHQTEPWTGSWGPHLETFQEPYAGTHLMGAIDTQLRSASAPGVWSEWARLDDVQSYIVNEELGFRPTLIQPNSDWTAVS